MQHSTKVMCWYVPTAILLITISFGASTAQGVFYGAAIIFFGVMSWKVALIADWLDEVEAEAKDISERSHLGPIPSLFIDTSDMSSKEKAAVKDDIMEQSICFYSDLDWAARDNGRLPYEHRPPTSWDLEVRAYSIRKQKEYENSREKS